LLLGLDLLRKRRIRPVSFETVKAVSNRQANEIGRSFETVGDVLSRFCVVAVCGESRSGLKSIELDFGARSSGG
jgi:hypothetical protein